MAPTTPTLERIITAAPPELLAEARRELAELRQMATATLHPVQLRILETMRGDRDRRWSPKELVEALGDLPLPNLAYHVRRLHGLGLIVKGGTAPRRGAVEHFYRLPAPRARATR